MPPASLKSVYPNRTQHFWPVAPAASIPCLTDSHLGSLHNPIILPAMPIIAHLEILHDEDILLAAVLLLDALLELAHRAPVARHRDAVSVALLGRRHRAQVDVVGLHVVFVAGVQARLARAGECRAGFLEDEGE